MRIIKDRDLINDVMDYDVILVGLNNKNSMGNGFAHKVARSFPYVYDSNAATKYDDPGKLGSLRLVKQEGKPTFVLCYITKGRFQPYRHPDALDYEAMEKCIRLVSSHFTDKKIASTIMGVSEFEAGGDKEKVMAMFKKYCNDMDLTLYDYEQVDYRQEDNQNYFAIMNAYTRGEIDKDEYYRRKSKFLWEKNFGLYEPIPEGLGYQKIKEEIKKKKDERA